MWINQICRLCAQASEILFPIFEKEGERPRLDIKIKKCLSLTVNEDDSKPKNICYNCTNKLEDYYEFLELCQSSDYKFESLIFSASEPRKWNDKMTNISAPNQPLSEPHDGVIVVGKMDESQNINRECQDILLMVELKYKDVEIDPQSEILKQNKVIYHPGLQDKQLFSQGVLRHSDDFRKTCHTKPSNPVNVNEDVSLDQISYPIPQNYSEQPIELIKPPYVQPSKIIKPVKSKPFPCNLCNKSFMRRSNLNAHMSIHTHLRPYRCEQCDRTFALRWNLTVHQRLHSGLYSCEYCGKAFPVKGKLERHVRVHTGEKPFSCNLPNCDKAFADKGNLEAHIRTHSEDRPFVCSICNRGFRSRSHLTDHRRVHSAETPFTCESCGKSFKWKTNLTIHMKSHTGEKFVCSDCGKQFARMTQLAKHKKVQHSSLSIKKDVS